MKKFGIAKSLIYTIIIVAIFFTSLEVFQRLRYFFRYRHAYWLLYGFVEKPDGYDQMLYKDKKRKEIGLRNVEIIEVRQISYGAPGDRYRKNNPKHKTDKVTINSYGFRGDEFDIAKDDGIFRIVALGASTTFGLGPDDSTCPVFLEKILNQRTDKDHEVINAGVGAIEIKEISSLFRNEVTRLEPDVIIINSLFNNLYLSSLACEGYEQLQKLNIFLMSKSLFYQTLREKVAMKLHKPVSDLYKVSADQMLANCMGNYFFWLDLENAYRGIIETARQNNCGVVIVKQPVLLLENNPYSTGMLLDKKLEPIYEKAYSLFDKIAGDYEDVYTADAAGCFETADNKEALFIDGLHLTPEGDELMAGIIAEKIIQLRAQD